MMATFDLGDDGTVEAVITDEANVIGKQVDLRWDCWPLYKGTKEAGWLTRCSIDGYVESYGWPEGLSPAYIVCDCGYHYAFRPAVLLCKLSLWECTSPLCVHASPPSRAVLCVTRCRSCQLPI